MAKKAAKKTKAQKRRKPVKKAAPRKRSVARKPRPRAKKAATTKARPKAVPHVKRSTGSPAGAGDSHRVPALERERRKLRELEETVQQAPSSLNMDRHGSAARSGRAALQHARRNHTETGPAITGGDVDADWEDAYAVGDEAPGGDNPTPDQDRVDDIGRALGIEYQDNEELKASDKVAQRDKHRWELDPASAEDYPDHDQD
jgi:hypothetical protein